ncbi:MAG: diguanylate cyclase [Vicinamibacteria bacterium]
MPEPGNPSASKTVAHGSLEELITPKLEPGRACLIVIRGRSVGMMVEVRERPVVVGRSPDVDLTIDDSAVSRRHAQIEIGPEGHVLTDLQSTNGIFVNGLRATRQPLRDGDRIQVGTSTILKFCFQDDVEASFQKSLYDSATRDGLTGAYNRKFFLETFEVDFSYAFKNGTALTLLMVDLDHFKQVNDTHGHLAGDMVLKDVTALVQRTLRTEDVLARYGGEEFAVLLRFTDAPRGFAVAERVRRAVEAQAFVYQDQELHVTASIGIASYEGGSFASPQEMLEAADDFLYRAKQGGRNRSMYVGIDDGRDRLTADTLSIRTDAIRAPAGLTAQPPGHPAKKPPKGGRGPRKRSKS